MLNGLDDQAIKKNSSTTVCVCIVIPFILGVDLVDVLAGVTQEEGRTGFLHVSSVVLALIFIARRIQSSLSLVDRNVDFFLCAHEIIVLHLLGMMRGKIPVCVTAPRFELSSKREKVRGYQLNHRGDRLVAQHCNSCFRNPMDNHLKKNLNAPRPSEHPPVRGKKCQNV